jgi:hypothetical protein
LLLILSQRIRRETGNDGLADAALGFASASHDYAPPREYEPLSEMCEDWKRRFDKTPEQNIDDRKAPMLRQSVRYIKNGGGGKWWAIAKARNQLHAKWDEAPPELLQKPDAEKIKACYQKLKLKLPTQDLNALLTLVNHPSQHVWVTFEKGYLWWCLVGDGVTDLGRSTNEHGHFFISCQPEYPWSNKSLAGIEFKITDLPGPVSSTAGFKGTVCEPTASEQILRLIHDEKNPTVVGAQETRLSYQNAVLKMVQQLHWKDFELLIGLIFDQTGWRRVSSLGGAQEFTDLDVENLVSKERASVQIKSETSQLELEQYIEEFETREQYQLFVFAVHKSRGELRTDNPKVRIWTGAQLAKLVVEAGMGAWLETKLA